MKTEPSMAKSTKLQPQSKARPAPVTVFSLAQTCKTKAKQALQAPRGSAGSGSAPPMDVECVVVQKTLRHDVQQDAQLQAWVRRVLQAANFDKTKLPSLLSEAQQYRPLAAVAHSSGAGVALSTAWLWDGLTEPQQKKRLALLRAWKAHIKVETDELKRRVGAARLPPGVKKGALMEKDWEKRLQAFTRYLSAMNGEEAHLHLHCARLAARLTLAGFAEVEDVAGMQPAMVQKLTDIPREQTLLTQFVHQMDHLTAQARMERLRRRMGMPEPEARGPRSAEALASTLTTENLESLRQSNAELQQSLGVRVDGGPRSAITSLASAKRKGMAMEVQEALRNRELELRLSSQRKSLPQVAAGLRAWHAFATEILDYDAAATIPPQSTEDVASFLACFSNGGTAANYLSYVRWACREFHKSLAWSQPSLGSLIRSIKKMDLLNRVASLPENVKVSEEAMERLILLAWELGDPEFGILACLAWAYLFRVQSEALPLEYGSQAEAVAPLAQDRHSSVYLDNGALHVRLRCRKNRPQGSLMVRNCSCQGDRDQRLCVVHCFPWQDQAVGEKAFHLTPTAATQKLRRYASMLSITGAQTLTLKTFRASRATSLALQGKPVHAILAAGEWRSAAVLNYCSPDAMDAGALLQKTIMQEAEATDDEDENE